METIWTSALCPGRLLAPGLVLTVDAGARVELHRLMAALRRDHGLAYLYVTHDVALADGFCDRLVVLDHGRVVEQGAGRRSCGWSAVPAAAQLGVPSNEP